MDAAELRVVLSALDERESRALRTLEHVWIEKCEHRTREVCERHGGHEFEKKGDARMEYEQCKYCDFTKGE